MRSVKSVFLSFLISIFGSLSVANGQPFLVQDINFQSTPSTDSRPRAFTPVGSDVYFYACDPSHGCELWRTDGSEEGTALVVDVVPGSADSQTFFEEIIADVGGNVAFNPNDGVHGPELWVTDGTSGEAQLLKDIVPGPLGTPLCCTTPIGSRLLFVDQKGPNAVWTSDGTPEGTEILLEGSDYPAFAQFRGAVYFAAVTSEFGEDRLELWRSDGTIGSTALVVSISGDRPREIWLSVLGDSLTLLTNYASGPVLLRTDGTSENTVIEELAMLIPELADVRVSSVAGFGEKLFLGTEERSNPNPSPPGLWISDGTADGTKALLALSDTPELIATGDRVSWFQNEELWTSDGTLEGTGVVALLPRPSDEYAVVDERLFFSLRPNDDSETELWVSDGTGVGTASIGDGFLKLTSLAPAFGQLFFAASRLEAGSEPWISDGTSEGTRLVRDINQSTRSADPSQLTDVSGRLFFTASDGIHGEEIWVTRGRGGAELVADLRVGELGSEPAVLTAVGSDLYFFFFAPNEGTKLGVSDGTEDGTRTLDLIFNSVEFGAFALGNNLLFAAQSGATEGIWRSNGTLEGTELVSASEPFQFAYQLTQAGDLAYFVGQDNQLLVTDGTTAGTISLHSHDCSPDLLTATVGEQLYYVVCHEELWTSNGTPESTRRVAHIDREEFFSIGRLFNVAGKLAFTAFVSSETGETLSETYELWWSDGTEAGTRQVREFDRRIAAVSAVAGGWLYFNSSNREGGAALWASDGTRAGTRPILELDTTGNLLAVRDHVVFIEQGDILRTDAAGDTMRVTSFTDPSIILRRSQVLSVSGENLYFELDTPEFRGELWALTLDEIVPQICPGDCDRNNAVAVDELVTGVAMALGNLPAFACVALDQSPADAVVSISELITAVTNALQGCSVSG